MRLPGKGSFGLAQLSRGRQIRRFLADEKTRRNFQPVPTLFWSGSVSAYGAITPKA
jgi:hypothetical protein